MSVWQSSSRWHKHSVSECQQIDWLTSNVSKSSESLRCLPSRALMANRVMFSCNNFITWLLSHDFITQCSKIVWCFYHMILSMILSHDLTGAELATRGRWKQSNGIRIGRSNRPIKSCDKSVESCDNFITWLLSHNFITQFSKIVWCFYDMIFSHTMHDWERSSNKM